MVADQVPWSREHLEAELAALRRENSLLREHIGLVALGELSQSDLGRYAQELAHSNAMLSALGQVAARVTTTFDPDLVMRTLGEELGRLSINSAVAIAEPGSAQLHLYHISLDAAPLALAERLVGMTWRDFPLAPDMWLFYRAFNEGQAFFIDDASPLVRDMLPSLPRWLVRQASLLVGVKPGIAAICAPLAFGGRAIGALALWGESLRQGDLPAVTLLADQVSIAIQNAQLYTASVERADDLARISENLRGELAIRAEIESELRASQRVLELQNRI